MMRIEASLAATSYDLVTVPISRKKAVMTA